MKHLKKLSLIILSSLLIMAFCQPLMAEGGKININTATQEQLMTLKNVGEKLAEKIIEHRKDNPFEKPEDIMKVKGIGEKVFDTNKEIIVVKDE